MVERRDREQDQRRDALRRRFGQLVAAHRRRLGWTQQELGERAGLSVDMVARVEGGGTGARFGNIANLAHALGIDPAELFTSELRSGSLARQELAAVTARLAGLSDRDLRWLGNLIDAALKPRS